MSGDGPVRAARVEGTALAVWWHSQSDQVKFVYVLISSSVLMLGMIVLCADLRQVPQPGSDDWHYAHMALGYPDESILSPFRHRVLVPWVAAALPLPVPWGFATVSAGLLGVAFAALWRFVSALSSERTACFGLALLFVSGFVTRVVMSPFVVDAVVLAATTLVFMFLHERRWFLLILAMPVAIAGHELSLLLLIPIMLTAWRERQLPPASVASLLAVVMWWILHKSAWLVAPNNGPNLLDPDFRSEMIRWNAMTHGSIARSIWFHLVTSFGVGWFLAPFGLKRTNQLLRDGLWILPFAAVLCFTASDWGRMFQIATPVIIGLACISIDRLHLEQPGSDAALRASEGGRRGASAGSTPDGSLPVICSD